MEFTTRPATLRDLDDLCAIEHSAIPGYEYLYDNRHFYEKSPGEMVLALTDTGLPVGMGRYSVLPDGSGWLEILRVKKEYQHMGAGRAIYRRYMELARQTSAPSVAMFTGRENLASKGLAEKNGFSLAAAYLGGDLALSDTESGVCGAFLEVCDPAAAKRLIEPHREKWGPFLVLNRTFFHYNDALYAYLCKEGMVYSDGENVVVLGARMLRERGLHLGMYGGDETLCLSFAASKAAALGAKKLTMMYPGKADELRRAALKAGYIDSGELIVMEWNRPKEE